MSIKHRLMSALSSRGFDRMVVAYWRLKGQNVDHLTKETLEARFTSIYDNGIWTDRDDQDSKSGSGSSDLSTQSLVQKLPSFLNSIKATSLIDIGCGDFHWMNKCALDCDYCGVDVVKSVIDQNTLLYGSPSRKFIHLDCTKEPLPYADVALCREVLFHLSFDDARLMLSNVKASGCKYVMLTSDPAVNRNFNIPSGAWRDINLRRSPFGLPQPDYILQDGVEANNNRVLGCWNATVLPIFQERC